MCCFDEKVKAQLNNNKTKKANLKPLPEPGIELGTTRTQSGCVTSAPSNQLRVAIVVKLFDCFHAMDRNVNKQIRICGPHIFNKFIFFCNIFKYMDNYIWQFLIVFQHFRMLF